jgi:uncharacterized protein
MKPENNRWGRFFSSITGRIIDHRWGMLIVIVLLTIFFAVQMQNLRLDNSNENKFLKNAPAMVVSEKFERIFGNEDFVYLLFDIGDSPSPHTLGVIHQLAMELAAGVPYLKDLTWLGNVEHVRGVDDGVEIRDFFDPFPMSSRDVINALNEALKEPLYVNSLISEDKKIIGLSMEMDVYPTDVTDPRKEIPPAVRKILSRPEYSLLSPKIVGMPVIDYEIDVITAREAALFFGLVLLVQAGLLWWLGRGSKGMIIPIVIMVVSNIWTFGLIAMLGFGLNLFSIMLPVLLVCVSIGYSMHIIAEFHDRSSLERTKKSALAGAVGITGLPCLLTAATTAVGFLSFMVTDSKMIREMGAYTALGVFIAFILTMTLVPILYSLGGPSISKGQARRMRQHDMFDRLLIRINSTVQHHPRMWVVIFIVLLGLSLAGYLRVEVETDMSRILSTRLPIRQDIDYVDAHMGGSLSVEIMIDTGVADGVKAPEFINRLEVLQQFVDDRPLSTKTVCILDTIKRIRQALHGDDPAYYSLPESREAVSQYLFLYETSGGEELDKLVSFDYSLARLIVKTRSVGTKELRIFMTALENRLPEIFPPDVKVELTGPLREFMDLADVLAKGQKKSFTAAVLAITLIMMLVLRSVRLGLISMIPNILPPLMALGLMGFTGIHMDLALMTFSAVIIGVAVDDTIHFFTRFRREFGQYKDYEKAIENTFLTVGRPITFTTITLVLGLLMLTPSAMFGIVRFGMLSGFAFLWALLADFFFAPAIILLTKPLGKEKTKKIADRQFTTDETKVENKLSKQEAWAP